MVGVPANNIEPIETAAPASLDSLPPEHDLVSFETLLETEAPIESSWEDATELVPAPAADPEMRRELNSIAQTAIASSAALAVERRQVEIAEAALMTAVPHRNPQLVLDLETPTGGDGPIEIGGRITFEILNSSLRTVRQRTALAGLHRAMAELESAELGVSLEVAEQVVEWMYLVELVSLRRRQVDLVRQLEKVSLPESAEANEEVDLVGQVQSQLAVDKREQELVAAQAAEDRCKSRLARLLDTDPDALSILGGKLVQSRTSLPTLPELLSRVDQVSSAVNLAALQLDESHWKHRLAQEKATPASEIGPTYRERVRDPGDQIGLRFETDLPIYDRNQDEIALRQAEIRKGEASIHAASQTVANAVVKLHEEFVSLEQRLSSIDDGQLSTINQYQALADNESVRDSISAAQRLELEEMILDVQAEQLGIKYRMTQIWAQLTIMLQL